MATLIIGGISLSEWEIPERINFGGRQQVTVHKLIGGNRTVDAMGPDPDDVRWSGRFRGPNALTRATALDALRASGAEVPLYYLGRVLTVVITQFRADAERSYEIPYQITCTVVADNINGALGAIVSNLDAVVGAALTVAVALSASGTSSAQTQTASAVATVSSAVDAAGTLQGASAVTLQSIASTVYTASSTIGTIATGLDATLGVGSGTDAGVDPDVMAAFITSQLQNCTDESVAIDSQNNINLIGKNLALATG
ncbi:amidohydrolase [Agrobacterium rhizogenes]|nr:amidohydrolase [Rhizobium rhizogenes]